MKITEHIIQCSCGIKIRMPVLLPNQYKELEEEYDMAERSAQESLSDLRFWLQYASFWELLKFWLRRGK